MKKYHLYKHKNSRDAGIYILRSTYIPEKDGYAVKFHWINLVSQNRIILTNTPINDFFTKEYSLQWDDLGEQGV